MAVLLCAANIDPWAVHLPGFIRLALHTVCCKSELLKLEWQRVDLKAGLLHFEANTQVRYLFGHSSVTMTERNCQLSPDSVHAAVVRLEGE